MHKTIRVGRGGDGPSLHFKIWYFPIIFLAKKVVYLVSNGKNEISPFLPTLRKSLASPGKFYYWHPPLVHNVWLIMDNWWTTVLWSGSTKLCNRFRKHFRWFALKYSFGLDIKKLDWPANLWCNFRNWRGNCPHSPPWLRALQLSGTMVAECTLLNREDKCSIHWIKCRSASWATPSPERSEYHVPSCRQLLLPKIFCTWKFLRSWVNFHSGSFH